MARRPQTDKEVAQEISKEDPSSLKLQQLQAIVQEYEKAFEQMEQNKFIQQGRFVTEWRQAYMAIIGNCRKKVRELSKR